MIAGQQKVMKGFFTKALFIRGQSSAEAEKRLGYRAGRLAQGWYLCFLLEMPNVNEFEVRGYSQMSGGVARGHLPKPPDPRNSEQRLNDDGFDLARIKSGLITRTFQLRGPERLAKVIPKSGEFGDNDYPPGSGIPQWTLVAPKRFIIREFIDPGKMYMGDYS